MSTITTLETDFACLGSWQPLMNAGYVMALYTNDYTPNRESVPTDFVLAKVNNQMTYALTRPWSDPFVNGEGKAQINSTNVKFQHLALFDSTHAYGFIVQNPITFLMFAERFANAPVEIPGDTVGLLVQLQVVMSSGVLSVEVVRPLEKEESHRKDNIRFADAAGLDVISEIVMPSRQSRAYAGVRSNTRRRHEIRPIS